MATLKDHPVKQRERAKKLAALAKVVKKHLKVEPLNTHTKAKPGRYISTGIQEIDDAISGRRSKKDKTRVKPGSGKGFPCGRIVEVFGPEAAAKTSLTLLVIAQAQKQGLDCVFIDAEHALDEDFATNTLGVNMDKLMLYEPDDGEQGLAILMEAVKLKVDVVVVDSVSALLPKAQKQGKEGLGAQARMMSSVCRELTSYLKKGDGPLVIFINQIRYKIGVMFGNPEMTSGGNALKFYASVRVEVRKKKDLKKASAKKGEPAVVGHRIRLKTVKNKIAPAYNSTLFDIRFGEGIRASKARASEEGDGE